MITVEAKGGGSGLRGRKAKCGRQAQQGSPEYRDSIIKNMEKKILNERNLGNNSDELNSLDDTLLAIQEASAIGQVKSICTQQELNSDGSLKPNAKFTEFSDKLTKPGKST